ncbi:ABC transporter ATP-binding protein [Maritimibacter sp. HL-12]|uniref:ABC transporter ATP-binding protein n=1 Tax=Maritimibacter sp. HL-12 TaxID=1162418 RepID=UPI000A0F3690|nr:ABC transporter ATP-binding protein [Maritimibacter sp. HL-12]SMH28909.1 oligopeptide transport system ATP-binding protein [Maritimibacter sp. HL-12]
MLALDGTQRSDPAGTETQRPGLTPQHAGAPLIEVSDLSVRFGAVTAVSSVSFSVAKGEVFGVVGESGAGKSATARAIIGLLPPTAKIAGSVRYKGEELVGASKARLRQARGAQIGYVFQDALTALDPVRTIGAQLVEVLNVHGHVSRRDGLERAADLLAELKINDPVRTLKAYPHQLSGGMRQRAVIAAALIANPELIIADEVTSALDVTVQRKVLDLLLGVCAARGAGVILITHDLGVVAQTSDRVAVLYGGIVAEEADVFSLFDNPRHPYSGALLNSMPRLGDQGVFEPIPGSAIQVFGDLRACPFADRCARVADDCRAGVPAPFKEGGTTYRCLHPLEDTA